MLCIEPVNIAKGREASAVRDLLYIAWQDAPGYSARDEDRNFAEGGGTFRERDEPRYVALP
jgi:hypothetical protein